LLRRSARLKYSGKSPKHRLILSTCGQFGKVVRFRPGRF
jgi:hypothetical protein